MTVVSDVVKYGEGQNTLLIVAGIIGGYMAMNIGAINWKLAVFI